MEMLGTIIQDSAFSLIYALEENVRLKKGNAAVYVTTLDAICRVSLPKASDYYGTTVFVYLSSTYTGTVSILAASGDSIARAGAAPVTSAVMNTSGEYILLYSSGLYWMELASNGVA